MLLLSTVVVAVVVVVDSCCLFCSIVWRSVVLCSVELRLEHKMRRVSVK